MGAPVDITTLAAKLTVSSGIAAKADAVLAFVRERGTASK